MEARQIVGDGQIERVLSRLGSKCIVLVGMMGAGKTSIGRRLAGALRLPFVDADSEIERRPTSAFRRSSRNMAKRTSGRANGASWPGSSPTDPLCSPPAAAPTCARRPARVAESMA
jgi:hypothetical protein